MIVSCNSVFPWLHVFIWLAVESMCFSRAATAMRQDGPSESFPAEILDAWKVYLRRMACFEYRSTVTIVLDGRTEDLSELVYRKGSGGYRLHASEVVRGFKPVERTTASRQGVEGFNSDYSFSAILRAPGLERGSSGVSSMAEVEAVTPGNSMNEFTEWWTSGSPFGLSFLNNMKWHHLVSNEGFRVERTAVSGAAGAREFVVWFEFNPVADKDRGERPWPKGVGSSKVKIRKGRAVFREQDLFLPSEVEFEVFFHPNEKNWYKGLVVQEFAETPYGRLPVAYRAGLEVIGNALSEKRTSDTTRTCEWLSVGKDFPESDFRLSGFGLPEPSFVKPKQNLVRRLVVIGICVIAGVLVVRQIRKTRR